MRHILQTYNIEATNNYENTKLYNPNASPLIFFFRCYFNGNFEFCVEQQVKQLQSLVQSAAVNRETITSPIPVPVPSTSLQFHQMSSFRMHRQYIRTLPFNSQIYG